MDFEIFGKVAKLYDTEDYNEANDCLDMIGNLADSLKGAMNLGYAVGHDDGYEDGLEAGAEGSVNEAE